MNTFRQHLCALVVLTFAILAGGCSGRTELPRSVLILVDASGSLTAAERTNSLDIVNTLLRDHIGDEERYTVAIAEGQLASEPLATGERLSNNAVQKRDYEKQLERQTPQIAQRLEAWVAASPRRASRTCLADTLAAAHRFFAGQEGYRPQVFLVSDMIEDCETAGADTRVNLCKLPVEQFKANWKRLPRLAADGAPIEVTALLPSKAVVPSGACTRALADVEEFWKGAAEQLGFQVRLHYFADLRASLITNR